MTPVPRLPTSGVPKPWRRLQVDPASGVPIWVQLKTQIEYFIATGAVPTGTRLPSVRALSAHLAVAVDTVRQTYSELGKAALVVTQHGVGTFTTLPADSGGDVASPEASWAQADTALAALIRAGSDPREATRAMAQRLALLHHGVDIVFAGVAASAERYARLISERLPAGLGPVRPLDVDALRAGVASAGLGPATYAVSLVFHRRELEQLLADRPIRVLSLMSRLEDGLLAPIGPAPSGLRLLLVARPETRPIYAALLQAQRPDLTDLPFVPDTDEGALASALEHADVVLYTSAAAGLVGRLARPRHVRIELRHVPHEKSLHDLARVLRADWELMLDLQRGHLTSL